MHQPISRKAELYKPRNGEAGTETCRVVKPSSVKPKEPPSPCGFTYGIAVYGPVCTVVWEGRGGTRSPYPDQRGACVAHQRKTSRSKPAEGLSLTKWEELTARRRPNRACGRRARL